jgi:hypothetical protein
MRNKFLFGWIEKKIQTMRLLDQKINKLWVVKIVHFCNNYSYLSFTHTNFYQNNYFLFKKILLLILYTMRNISSIFGLVLFQTNTNLTITSYYRFILAKYLLCIVEYLFPVIFLNNFGTFLTSQRHIRIFIKLLLILFINEKY